MLNAEGFGFGHIQVDAIITKWREERKERKEEERRRKGTKKRGEVHL